MDAPHSMLEAEEDGGEVSPAPTDQTTSSRIRTTLRHRWPEYVLEVIVIVFSISLSFALDAWRESHHRHELEQLYLRTLDDNLQSDDHTLDDVIGGSNAVLASTRRLMALSQNPSAGSPERFRADVGSMVQRPSFVAHDAAFANLRSSGNLEVIRNFALKNALFDYYQDIEAIKATEGAEREALIFIIGPFLLRSMPLHPMSGDADSGTVMRNVLGNIEFQNGCWVRIQNRSELLGKYQKVRSEEQRIRAAIRKQLD
jgi:hypothetical protein